MFEGEALGMATILSDRHSARHALLRIFPFSSGRIKDIEGSYICVILCTRKRKVGVKICRRTTTYVIGLTINNNHKSKTAASC